MIKWLCNAVHMLLADPRMSTSKHEQFPSSFINHDLFIYLFHASTESDCGICDSILDILPNKQFHTTLWLTAVIPIYDIKFQRFHSFLTSDRCCELLACCGANWTVAVFFITQPTFAYGILLFSRLLPTATQLG